VACLRTRNPAAAATKPAVSSLRLD
jgi:hypothetical protein